MTADQSENSRRNPAAHLAPHQFVPGQSGNPTGRPKGIVSLTTLMRQILDSKTIAGKPIPNDRTVADVFAEVMVKEALKGKFPFAKEVLERMDGKVPDQVQIDDIRKAYVTESPDTLCLPSPDEQTDEPSGDDPDSIPTSDHTSLSEPLDDSGD